MLLYGVCLLLTAVHIGYWIVLDSGFLRALRTSDEFAAGAACDTPSVVIAARNEAQAISALVQALQRQTLPPREVVLVDDGSSDGTADAAERAAANTLNLRILRRPDDGGSKKSALTDGIKQATSSVVALTDGDCVPDLHWLEGIARVHGAGDTRRLVVGYSPCVREAGVLNRLARYETLVTGILTAAAAGLRRGYMAVGRNLSYRRETFEGIGGFAHSAMIRSGDDDLLVQEVRRRNAAEVVPLLEPDTFVETRAPASWRSWLRQKRRHAAASRHYDRGPALHLAVLHASGFAAWLFPFVLGWFGAALLALRLGAQFLVLRRASRALGDRDLLAWFVPLELGYALISAVLVPLALVFKPKRW